MVLVFEIYDLSEGSHAFLRSKHIGSDGHMTVVGMPVEKRMLKHHEPYLEVLEPRGWFSFA
jgi:hypothetical protein